MPGTFNSKGEIPTETGVIVTCFGKKGSGKSIMGLTIFRGYPNDRIVIDVAGDDGPTGEDVIELKGTVSELPKKWPEHLRKDKRQRMTLRYVPDAGSPTYLEDIDAVVGLAMTHGDCAILIHEVGQAAPANRTPPHMSRLLQANRHRRVTAIFCGPRPMGVDPLVIGQSDLVYVFEMQVVADRQRVAETIGWNVKEFAEAVDDLGAHEYLRFDSKQEKPQGDEPDYRLVHFPALPKEVADSTQSWAQGKVRA